MESVDYPKWQPLSLHEVCMQHIRLVLGLCQGNRTQAARILGVGRTTLYRYLQEKQNVNGTSSAPREVGPSTGPLSASRQSATEALGKALGCGCRETARAERAVFRPLELAPKLLQLCAPPCAAEPARTSPTKMK